MTDDDTEWAEFVAAVEADEYAEYELRPGLFLLTDWEGDGVFNPWVQPTDGTTGSDHEQEVSDALSDRLDVHNVEWDENNAIYAVHADRPT